MAISAAALGENKIEQDDGAIRPAAQMQQSMVFDRKNPETLSREVVLAYRGLHALEEANGDPSIVDSILVILKERAN